MCTCTHTHAKKNYDHDPEWIYSYCTYFKHKTKQFGMNEQVFGSYFTLIYFFLNDIRMHILFFIILLRKSYNGIFFTVLCSLVRTQLYELLFFTKEDTTS